MEPVELNETETALHDFLEKYELDTFSLDDVEDFVEKGVMPLLEEYETLILLTNELAHENLHIFKNNMKAIEGTRLYELIGFLLKLTEIKDLH